MHKWKDLRIPINYVRYDNPGENKSLKNRADNSNLKLGIGFE